MVPVIECLQPEWPAPAHVRAVTTTRQGGVSKAPYNSLNLGDHVGDAPEDVAENRRRLVQELSLPSEPRWLKQLHGVLSPCADELVPGECEADASYTRETGVVCAVLTADCLPLLFCDKEGREIAAVHAGWRGLLDGVIESTLQNMTGDRGDILAWLGPAIGPTAFEVGDEVKHAFVERDGEAGQAFSSSDNGRWLADLYQLARQRLISAGVSGIYGGGLCTYSDRERFYSYRRDGVTGRMASLIWISEE